MVTDAGWSGGEEMGLNGAPVITSQPLSEADSEKNLTSPAWLQKRPQVTVHVFCQLRKGPSGLGLQRGCCGHNSYKRSHVLCSLQVELCCGFICSSQQPLNYALCVPIFTATERSTGQDHTDRKWQSRDLNLDTWFKILNSPWIWHCTLDPRGME